MELIKIHNVYENTHNYHAVFVRHGGEVIIRRAEYMALVTVEDTEDRWEGQRMRPMVMDKVFGELRVCGGYIRTGHPKYAGYVCPGDDALSLIDGDEYPEAIEWLKREGITELIVPGGGR